MFEQQWAIPLNEQPTILQLAVGVHGHKTVEHYQITCWSLHFYQYAGEVRINDIAFPIQPGYVSITPPRATLEYRLYGRSVHNYCHFSCTGEQAQTTPIPAMQNLDNAFATLNQAVEQAIGYWPMQPQRATARLWDILWQLTDQKMPGRATTTQLHPIVSKTLSLIELRLSEPFRVADLAAEVGISHNHLTRLFRAALGKTITGYIQECRVQRARHLLLYSTRPIKSIAAEVGIADLHLFNKTIRAALGASPRAIRQQSDML